MAQATVDVYNVWAEKSCSDSAHYKVGISCINRVLVGLKSVLPSKLGNANKLHRLWVHEICRVWGDRLTSEEDRFWFLKHLDRISTVHFKQNLNQYLFASSLGNVDYRTLPKIHFSKLQSANGLDVDEVGS